MKLNERRNEPAQPAAPRRGNRFRIDRLEERIAPKRGGGGTGGTNKCTNNCAGTDSLGGSGY